MLRNAYGATCGEHECEYTDNIDVYNLLPQNSGSPYKTIAIAGIQGVCVIASL